MRRLVFIVFLLLAQFIAYEAIAVGFQSKYPELQKIYDNGASSIGGVEYTLDVGWWQYTQSCDTGKWISYNQKFDKRKYRGAACDQQKHDYKTTVEPTLNTTSSSDIPENGQIFIVSELQASDDNLRRKPAVNATIKRVGGSVESIRVPIIGQVLYGSGKKIYPSPSLPQKGYQVQQGDTINISIAAGWWSVADGNWIPPQGAEVQVFLVPDNATGECPKNPSLAGDRDNDGVPDYKDLCPDTLGNGGNYRGCPSLEEKWKRIGSIGETIVRMQLKNFLQCSGQGDLAAKVDSLEFVYDPKNCSGAEYRKGSFEICLSQEGLFEYIVDFEIHRKCTSKIEAGMAEQAKERYDGIYHEFGHYISDLVDGEDIYGAGYHDHHPAKATSWGTAMSEGRADFLKLLLAKYADRPVNNAAFGLQQAQSYIETNGTGTGNEIEGVVTSFLLDLLVPGKAGADETCMAMQKFMRAQRNQSITSIQDWISSYLDINDIRNEHLFEVDALLKKYSINTDLGVIDWIADKANVIDYFVFKNNLGRLSKKLRVKHDSNSIKVQGSIPVEVYVSPLRTFHTRPKGTEYQLDIDDAGSITVSVQAGTVEVIPPAMASVQVHAGQSYTWTEKKSVQPEKPATPSTVQGGQDTSQPLHTVQLSPCSSKRTWCYNGGGNLSFEKGFIDLIPQNGCSVRLFLQGVSGSTATESRPPYRLQMFYRGAAKGGKTGGPFMTDNAGNFYGVVGPCAAGDILGFVINSQGSDGSFRSYNTGVRQQFATENYYTGSRAIWSAPQPAADRSVDDNLAGTWKIVCVANGKTYKFDLVLKQFDNRVTGHMARTNGWEINTKVDGRVLPDNGIEFTRSTGNWRQHYVGGIETGPDGNSLKMSGKFGDAGKEKFDWQAIKEN